MPRGIAALLDGATPVQERSEFDLVLIANAFGWDHGRIERMLRRPEGWVAAVEEGEHELTAEDVHAIAQLRSGLQARYHQLKKNPQPS